jgi:tetratricopeptide (TPR) repeat protein
MRSRQKKIFTSPGCLKLKKNGNESEELLIGNYLINELNSLEESGRQLISVYSILIGAYLAILISDISIVTIKNIVRLLNSYYKYSFDSILIVFILTLLPILPWFFGIYKCSNVLRPENYDLENDFEKSAQNRKPIKYYSYISRPNRDFLKSTQERLNADEVSEFLSRIIKIKYSLLKRCHLLMGVGLVIVVIIFLVNVICPVYFSYHDAKDQYNRANYNESIKLCDEVIAEFPMWEWPWLLKGNSYALLGNYTEAIKCYDECNKLNPNDAQAWNSKGLALDNLELPSEANAAFAKAKELGYTG